MEKFDHAKAVSRLKSNIQKEFDAYFPFEREDYRFEVKDIKMEEPSTSYDDQQNAFLTDDSIEAKVRGTIEVYYKGERIKTHQNAVLTRVPYPTDRGSYIAGGNEMVVLNRMQMRNGVYIHPMRDVQKTQMITAEVRSGNQRFKINFDTNRAKFKLEDLSMDFGKRNPGAVDVIALLRFLGVDESKIKDAIGEDELYESMNKNVTNSSGRKIYGAFFSTPFPGDEDAKKQIKAFLSDQLTFDEDSQKITKQTIGTSLPNFDEGAFLRTLSQLTKEYKTPGSSPQPDDLRFKEIKSAEDTVGEYVRKGIREWINNRLRRITYGEMNEQKRKNLNAKPEQFVYKGTKELYSSDVAELVDSANPLDVHQKLYKVTSLGAGGLNSKSATNPNRNMQDTAFAKIDAVETPQSSRMGLVQHFASGASVKNGRLYSKFYRVKNGKIDRSNLIDDIDPLDEFEEYIAFNNPKEMEKGTDGKAIGFKNDEVRVRHKGKFINVPKNKVTLVDYSPTSHMSHSTSLIPFGGHNDGARMLMGAGMQKQSLSLEEPDAPLVQSLSDPATGKTAEEEMAERASYILKSPVSGTVDKINEDSIDIKKSDGTIEKVKKLNYFTTGKAGGYIHHKPVVKPGDKVKADDLLADGWQSKNGKLALGKNVRVAYMPFKGYNFEDGVVVSESFAKKMSSEEVKTVTVEMDSQNGSVHFGGKEALDLLKDLHVSPGILSKLDNQGVIKKGEELKPGDVLVAAVKEKEQQDMSAGQRDIRRMMRNKIVNLPSDNYKDVSKKAVGYQGGKVIEVNKNIEGDKLKVNIKLLSFKPMELGDKLSGRHGNKGTITAILPDKEMPQTEEGSAVELIFSPLAVPSRKNIGQLMEVNAGLVAEKKGMDAYKVQNFDSSEREKLEKELESIGMPDGKQTLINPDTGKPYENKVTVGPMYILKLKHKVEGKITSRNINGSVDEVHQSPRKTSGNIDGDRHNPQGLGGMEFWSLTSAGAVNNIHEMTTLKSDGAGDRKRRAEIFSAIRKGMPIPDPVTPETVKVLQDKLYAAGVQMTPLKGDKEVTMDEKFTELMLNPMKRDDLKKLAPSPVVSSKGLNARTNAFAPGGIYDPEIFGEEGNNWSRIDLIEPMPNPLFLEDDQGVRPYEAMLISKGLKQKDIKNLANGKQFIVTDPKDSGLEKGQLVDIETLDNLDMEGKDIVADTGGSAIANLIQGVDFKEELKKAEERLSNAKNLSQRSAAQKHVNYLSRALDRGLDPKDFLMESVPVLPVKYREPLQLGEGKTFAEDGISKLYQSLLMKNQEVARFKDNYDDPLMADRSVYSGMKGDYYKGLKNIIGVGEPAKDDKRGQEIKGIMHSLKSKQGYIRSKMQTKLQDYSGRSVISVDPTLKLDQVALPEDMAADIFNPKIVGELQNQGYSGKEIQTFVKRRTPEFTRALTKVSENHPVILNRQPSLHRHSLQAFYPKILWNEDGSKKRAIGLNPVVTTAFNADFDGDTMAVHLPITDGAIKEAKEKLLPSQNLLNPTHNGIITDLKHEMQLGIYYMTRDRMPTGAAKQFKNLKELKQAYDEGKVKTYDAVQMSVPGKGMVRATAGQHIFNLSLPKGFQDYENNIDVNKKKMQGILENIINSKNGGTFRAVDTINKLQTVGFDSATKSGISIGIKDFDSVVSKDRKELFDKAEKSLKDKYKDRSVSGMIDAKDAMEQEKSEIVSAELKSWIQNNMDPDNPVGIMMNSGARGNAGQVNSMAGIIGVGKDVASQKTRPVNSSHLEGLSPDQFWDLSYDSRKGILDKSIETSKPGELTRELWMTNKQTVISEKDCGDSKGIMLDMQKDGDKRSLHGRVLLKDVPLAKGGSIKATGKPLTVQEEEAIMTKAKGLVNVRSPLTCKSTAGVCQKCYGIKPGGVTNDLVEIGAPIGSVAAQALGEPSTQSIMKAFHVGAANSSVSGAFDRIQETLRLPQDLSNTAIQAVIAEEDGVISDITTDPITGTVVKVGRKKYKLHKKQLADFVKVGVSIKKGDLLTKEFSSDGSRLVVRNPHDVLKYQGADAAKSYISSSIEEAYAAGDIKNTDRRHYEVVTNNLMNKAVVTNPGTSPFREGQAVSLDTIQRYNKNAGRVVSVPMNFASKSNVIGAVAAQDYSEQKNPLKTVVKKGDVITEEMWEKLKYRPHIKVKKKPLQFEQQLSGVRDKNLADENWLDTAAYGDASNIISRATTLGMKDKLDTPLTQQMTGKKGNFSEGYRNKEEDKGFMSGFINGFL